MYQAQKVTLDAPNRKLRDAAVASATNPGFGPPSSLTKLFWSCRVPTMRSRTWSSCLIVSPSVREVYAGGLAVGVYSRSEGMYCAAWGSGEGE